MQVTRQSRQFVIPESDDHAIRDKDLSVISYVWLCENAVIPLDSLMKNLSAKAQRLQKSNHVIINLWY